MLDPRDLSDERPRTPPEAARGPEKRALSWDETKDAEREVFGRSMVSVDIGRANLMGEAQAAGLTYDEALQSRLATVRNRRQHRSAEHPDRAGHRREYDPRNDHPQQRAAHRGGTSRRGNVSQRLLQGPFRVAVRKPPVHHPPRRGRHDPRRPASRASCQGTEGRQIQGAHLDRGRSTESPSVCREAGFGSGTANMVRPGQEEAN